MQCYTDSFEECDGYDLTTAAETTDVEEEEAQTTKKRHQRKRSFDDFLTWSAGMYSLHSYSRRFGQKLTLGQKGSI